MDVRSDPAGEIYAIAALDFDGCVFNKYYIAACHKDRADFVDAAYTVILKAYNANPTVANSIAIIFREFKDDMGSYVYGYSITKKFLKEHCIARQRNIIDIEKDPRLLEVLDKIYDQIGDQIENLWKALHIKLKKNVITYNERLINNIIARAKAVGATKIVPVSLSNRQSRAHNSINMRNGDSFTALIDLAVAIQKLTEIQVEIDLMLLADIMGDRADGANVEAHLKGDNSISDPYQFDRNKTSLAYCHFHKYSQLKGEVYYFGVDNEKWLLLDLCEFYSANLDLVGSANLHVEFLHYEGDEVSTFVATADMLSFNPREYKSSFSGLTLADAHYRESLKFMLSFACVPGSLCEEVTLSHTFHMNIERLIDFKVDRLREPSEVLKMFEYYIPKHADGSDYHPISYMYFVSTLKKMHVELSENVGHQTADKKIIMNSVAIKTAKEVMKMLLWLQVPAFSTYYNKDIYIKKERQDYLLAFASTASANSNTFAYVDAKETGMMSYFKRKGNQLLFHANGFSSGISELKNSINSFLAQDKILVEKAKAELIAKENTAPKVA